MNGHGLGTSGSRTLWRPQQISAREKGGGTNGAGLAAIGGRPSKTALRPSQWNWGTSEHDSSVGFWPDISRLVALPPAYLRFSFAMALAKSAALLLH